MPPVEQRAMRQPMEPKLSATDGTENVSAGTSMEIFATSRYDRIWTRPVGE
jgi:hypothetical protein